MIIKVRVISTAGDNEVVSRIGSVLRVKVKTKKLDSEANDILKYFMADFFSVTEEDINIIKGNKGKEKTVEVRGKSEEALKKVMDAIP
ncbi:DUF167 domain-containing protein [Candidatus Proelusimicrobium excrementi]|uniref:DUF167 domain-containing protein n=1 Tax=Candidatus Proelusimicrobium excrementi TaxID=3416222 RepID=UPI003CA69FFC|nr:DUF167 domain-containing protein [Elusimicrobiaceae bacterium]MDD6173590.1 DUF167 domain-containing protein [Elusimicrobiota bacterium]